MVPLPHPAHVQSLPGGACCCVWSATSSALHCLYCVTDAMCRRERDRHAEVHRAHRRSKCCLQAVVTAPAAQVPPSRTTSVPGGIRPPLLVSLHQVKAELRLCYDVQQPQRSEHTQCRMHACARMRIGPPAVTHLSSVQVVCSVLTASLVGHPERQCSHISSLIT
jgi:hypothetical protein